MYVSFVYLATSLLHVIALVFLAHIYVDLIVSKYFFFTKWPPAAIFNDRKSLSIAFLSISDQYATFYLFFHKKAAGGHFG